MSIKTIYSKATLAQASYALFHNYSISDVELALKENGKGDFTEQQAIKFNGLYSINGGQNGHLPNTTSSDFSATLFQDNNDNNKLTLAIRGTEAFIGDLIDADIHGIGFYVLALKQTLDLYNFVSRLKVDENDGSVRQLSFQSSTCILPPEGVTVLFTETVNPNSPNTKYYYLEETFDGQGLGLIQPGQKITVTGHSLGGHLSALSSLLFPDLVDAAYMFNASGFDPASSRELTFDVVEAITGIRYSEFPGHKLFSYEAETLLGDDDYNVVLDIAVQPTDDIKNYSAKRSLTACDKYYCLLTNLPRLLSHFLYPALNFINHFKHQPLFDSANWHGKAFTSHALSFSCETTKLKKQRAI